MNIIFSLVLGLGVGFAGGWFVANKNNKLVKEFTSEDKEIMQHAREAVASRIAKRLNKIMSVVEEKGRITNDGVEELFCISDRTASNYLRTLTKDGKLTRRGSGRGTYYTLPN